MDILVTDNPRPRSFEIGDIVRVQRVLPGFTGNRGQVYVDKTGIVEERSSGEYHIRFPNYGDDGEDWSDYYWFYSECLELETDPDRLRIRG